MNKYMVLIMATIVIDSYAMNQDKQVVPTESTKSANASANTEKVKKGTKLFTIGKAKAAAVFTHERTENLPEQSHGDDKNSAQCPTSANASSSSSSIGCNQNESENAAKPASPLSSGRTSVSNSGNVSPRSSQDEVSRSSSPSKSDIQRASAGESAAQSPLSASSATALAAMAAPVATESARPASNADRVGRRIPRAYEAIDLLDQYGDMRKELNNLGNQINLALLQALEQQEQDEKALKQIRERLEKEERERISADRALQKAIDNEELERKSADRRLQEAIDQEMRDRRAADDQEMRDRKAADNNLEERLNDEQERLNLVEAEVQNARGTFSNLHERLESGTARIERAEAILNDAKGTASSLQARLNNGEGRLGNAENRLGQVENQTQAFCKFSINASDRGGRTALHNAAIARDIDAFRKLIVQGANRNAYDRDGLTAFHLAVKSDAVDIIEYALGELHISPEIATNWRETLLFYVQSKAMLDLLLRYNANVHAKDWWWWTPLDYAYNYGNNELVKELKSRRAQCSVPGYCWYRLRGNKKGNPQVPPPPGIDIV